MAFDAAALAKALTPPAVIVSRTSWWERPLVALGALSPVKTYTGRILSHAEFAPFAERWLKANRGELSAVESIALVEEYLVAIGIPPKVVYRLPYDVAVGVLRDFLASQVRTMSRLQRRSPRRSPGAPHANGAPSGFTTPSAGEASIAGASA